MKKPKKNLGGRPRHRKQVFTYEILPPGTLRRKPASRKSSKQRWEDIKEVCIQIIEENSEEKNLD